jgi:hypothetical protein
VLGAWCLVLGAWCLVLGAWCLVLGAWCLVLGAWCLVLCALCFVLCALCFVLCALCFVLRKFKRTKGAITLEPSPTGWVTDHPPRKNLRAPCMGLAKKKVPKQQREKVIGDLLLVNRKEVLLFVIQRLFPSREVKPFTRSAFTQ